MAIPTSLLLYAVKTESWTLAFLYLPYKLCASRSLPLMAILQSARNGISKSASFTAADAGGGTVKSGPRRMLSEKQVLEIVPVGRTTLYRMEKASRFPKSTYVSPNRRVWFEDEVIAWQNAVDEFNPNRGRGKGRART